MAHFPFGQLKMGHFRGFSTIWDLWSRKWPITKKANQWAILEFASLEPSLKEPYKAGLDRFSLEMTVWNNYIAHLKSLFDENLI